ncbi:hypothetical protein GQ600_3454 [Phytophthora cactorum]|nr:hypothetical protein GQ600_3454 [Phytophthora cactorum]
MIKRLVVLLLVVLVAMLSVACADDAPAAPAAEDAPTEQLPPGVSLLSDKEPVPSSKEQLEQFIVVEVASSRRVESRTAGATRTRTMEDSATAGATRSATGTDGAAPSTAGAACLGARLADSTTVK